MPKSISQFVNANRTVRVPLTFVENGERKTEELEIVYRATATVMVAIYELSEANQDTMVEILARVIVSIPEIADEAGAPIEINAETIGGMDYDNVKAIYTKVLADLRPTQAPTTSPDSQPISETEPAAQT